MTDQRGFYSRAFKLAALERMAAGENVSALASELGVKRTRLYEWRDRFRRGGEAGLRGRGRPSGGVGVEVAPAPLDDLAAAKRRIAELERKVGQQELDLDFFQQALRHVGARRPGRDGHGGTGSTKSSKP